MKPLSCDDEQRGSRAQGQGRSRRATRTASSLSASRKQRSPVATDRRHSQVKGKNPVLHQNEKLKLKIASTVFQQIKDAGLIDDRKSYSVDDLARLYNITRDAAVLVTKMLEAA
jgi:hypothetical protein